MLRDLLSQWGEWAWIIAGLVLMLLELVTPGVSLIWLGIAAIAIGIIALNVDIAWQMQVLFFALIAIVSAYLAGRALRLREARSSGLRLNDRALRLIGHTYPLSEPISSGVGRIRVEDSTWGVAGPELPAGTLVRVTGHDGTLLTVVRSDS